MDATLSRRFFLAAVTSAAAGRPRWAGAQTCSLDPILRQRRMVRRFRSTPVGEAQVQRLLDAATRAPSAGHTEPWAFVVVRNRELRTQLGRAAFNQVWLAEAPVSIVPCADLPRATQRYGERGERYALIDTAFASMLLLLAVTAEGLGACFVGAFHDAEVKRLLRLPPTLLPLAVIPVGYPAEKPRSQRRRPLREIIHAEHWNGGAGQKTGDDPTPAEQR
jgi:nitroreductase